MTISTNRPKEYDGGYGLRGSYRLVASTGLATLINTRTTTAGFLFGFRWSSTTSTKCFLKRVGVRYTCTTAFTTAQRVGVDMILARTFTAPLTGGSAVDVGSTVANTGNLAAAQSTSLVAASQVVIATTADLTAGTHTLDANPIGHAVSWIGSIGDQCPGVSSGAAGDFALLWDAEKTSHKAPIMFTSDEGFILRNVILGGAVGVGGRHDQHQAPAGTHLPAARGQEVGPVLGGLGEFFGGVKGVYRSGLQAFVCRYGGAEHQPSLGPHGAHASGQEIRCTHIG